MSRALLAGFIGVLGFLLYVGAVVVLADQVLTRHWLLQLTFFVAAGLLWTWPAKWLMAWGAARQNPGG